MFNLFKNFVQSKSIVNNKMSNPMKINNSSDDIIAPESLLLTTIQKTNSLYSKEEIRYLKSLRGKCKSWKDAYEKYNKKFPNKRSFESFRKKALLIDKENNTNYTKTGKGFTKFYKWTPEIYSFLQEHSKNMTVQEIRDTLASCFNCDLERDVVHTYLTNNNMPYKQVKERIKELDKVIIDIYNSMNKEELGKSLSKCIADVASIYFNKNITRVTVNNVLYRNGLKHCTSFYIAQKYKEKK